MLHYYTHIPWSTIIIGSSVGINVLSRNMLELYGRSYERRMREIEPKISQIAMQTRQDQQILYRKQPFYDRTQLNDIDRNIKAQFDKSVEEMFQRARIGRSQLQVASLLSFWFWISCFGVLRDIGSMSLLCKSRAPPPDLSAEQRVALARFADAGLVVPFAFRPHSLFSPPGWTPLLLPPEVVSEQMPTEPVGFKKSRLWGLLYFFPALLMLLLAELAAELRIIHGFYTGVPLFTAQFASGSAGVRLAINSRLVEYPQWRLTRITTLMRRVMYIAVFPFWLQVFSPAVLLAIATSLSASCVDTAFKIRRAMRVSRTQFQQQQQHQHEAPQLFSESFAGASELRRQLQHQSQHQPQQQSQKPQQSPALLFEQQRGARTRLLFPQVQPLLERPSLRAAFAHRLLVARTSLKRLLHV